MITETKTRRVEPDITVVEIAGRLSLGNTLLSIENTLKRLVDEGSRRLVVDVSGLNSVDSSGIGMLVSCFAHMEQQGGHMRVAGAHGSVLKVFETVHLDRIVPAAPDAESACRDIPAGAA
jgi:anti-sigma B factor antagonist